ncbi:hydroxymethylpyrimidine/phosphomethylpyrimidine kinase [Prosthecobacter fusiformis]|uniref:hydroxymethylpyrimidine kinase n=1 Tax=Prosthecobacter fusiformis TaxID=48464 RepID=A0A4R7RWJ3_9BACT|nr:bifunctional hydroxymethylpyrimidine kinase/phosphomethylpyrimidine kinase [Prosthecobacter fusiformis]TDU69398.1 hydroxymethylpyrimidine/phosphomethylpyrimidine kinase [Prosthecobacter fusiformis]
MSPPPILTIAGSDSSCGAGVQADLKAISALGGYALNALTSVVSETPGRVSIVRLLDAELVSDQIRILFEGFPIAAVKTGMLGGLTQVEAVVKTWQSIAPVGLPLVVDPVMVATGGGKLLEDDAIDAVRTLLLPLATVITPNMDEAAVLWGRPVTTRDEMTACAQDMSAEFGTAVLLKGGHLTGSAADVLCINGELTWYDTSRTPDVQTHGTGCTYSAAIATGLGLGLPLQEAVSQAKRYISAAIAEYFQWNGSHGTVHALNHLKNSSL